MDIPGSIGAAQMDKPEEEDETPRHVVVTAALAAAAAVVLAVLEDPAAGDPAAGEPAAAKSAASANRSWACGPPIPVAVSDRAEALSLKK